MMAARSCKRDAWSLCEASFESAGTVTALVAVCKAVSAGAGEDSGAGSRANGVCKPPASTTCEFRCKLFCLCTALSEYGQHCASLDASLNLQQRSKH